MVYKKTAVLILSGQLFVFIGNNFFLNLRI
jgi:hypothetical protein